jgi:sporulation protein YlmC with PRC-barrel domain
MRLGKDLLNKPIISLTDGRNLGTVKDIYTDANLTTITGIFTGQEGLLKRKSYLIPRSNVVVFGIDAILVKHTDVILEEADIPDAATWARLSKLRGRQIDTPNGTRVAAIGDIIIGEDGDIVGFALAKVFVEGPIAEKGAIPRTAMQDTGNEDGLMTIDLTIAETETLTAVTPPPPTPPATLPDETP